MLLDEFSQLKHIRRDLHKIPEIAFYEQMTKKYIKDYVLNLNSFKPFYEGKYGLIYVKEGYKSKKSIAFRAELDGLPINDNIKTDYTSIRDGYSHACGHDAHMAILLYVMFKLDKMKLPYGVTIIFQSAEEVFSGASYLLKFIKPLNIDKIIACHLTPEIPYNNVVLSNNDILASNYTCEINLGLVEGHVFSSFNYLNLYNEIYNFVENFNNNNRKMAIVGIKDNAYYNITPSNVVIYVSIRSFNDIDYNEIIKELINRIGGKTSLTFATKKQISNYPKIINSYSLFKIIEKISNDLNYNIIYNQKSFSSDDFAFYQSIISDTFYFLIGCYINDTYKCHTSKFDIDEKCLLTGFKIFMKLVDNFNS